MLFYSCTVDRCSFYFWFLLVYPMELGYNCTLSEGLRRLAEPEPKEGSDLWASSEECLACLTYFAMLSDSFASDVPAVPVAVWTSASADISYDRAGCK